MFLFCCDSPAGTKFSGFFFPALFFEFVRSYRAGRKAEQRVEQTPSRDKLNLPPTAGDGNYSGSGNQAASLWLCKVHSKSQSLSSLLPLCLPSCLSCLIPSKIRIQKESETAIIVLFLCCFSSCEIISIPSKHLSLSYLCSYDFLPPPPAGHT